MEQYNLEKEETQSAPNQDDNKKKKEENKNNSETRKREFILNDTVSNTSVKDILMGILDINRKDEERESKNPNYIRKPINLIVNTYGGSVYEGFGLVAAIDSSETPVHTYLYGKAMSMGLLIFVSGHKRFAHPLGTLMYHQISTGVQGKIEDIKKALAQAERLNDTYDNYLMSVTDIPKELLEDTKAKKEELYLPALEAIEYGMVDEIIPSRRRNMSA
jgi:ATP-dependent Clp protease, protease subunit